MNSNPQTRLADRDRVTSAGALPEPNAAVEQIGFGTPAKWIVWTLSLALLCFYCYLFTLEFPYSIKGRDSFASRCVSTGIVCSCIFSLIYAITVSRSSQKRPDAVPWVTLVLPFAIAAILSCFALAAVYKWEIHRMWHHKLERLSIYFYLSALAFSISTIVVRQGIKRTRARRATTGSMLFSGSLFLATCLLACLVVNNIVLIYVEMFWTNERNVFLYGSLMSCIVLAILGIRHISHSTARSRVPVPTRAQWIDICVMYIIATIALTGLGVGILEFIRAPRTQTSSITVTAQHNWGTAEHSGQTTVSVIPLSDRVRLTIREETKAIPMGVSACVLAALVLWNISARIGSRRARTTGG